MRSKIKEDCRQHQTKSVDDYEFSKRSKNLGIFGTEIRGKRKKIIKVFRRITITAADHQAKEQIQFANIEQGSKM